MKIAIYGDSLADPKHYLYSYRYNSRLSRAAHQYTWAEKLKHDGHTVDFYTGMSRHPLWVDEQYQATKDQYDKRIIRSYNWNMPNFNWHNYDEIVSEELNDFAPGAAHIVSKKIDQNKKSVQAIHSWVSNELNPKHNARVFKLLIQDWISDKDTLFITPALIKNMEYKIPMITPWNVPEVSIVQERNSWLKEIGCTSEQFSKIDPLTQSMLWHKHINHIPIETHRSVYEHIANWIETGKQDKPIEIKAWDYYNVDCDVCKEMEREMKC